MSDLRELYNDLILDHNKSPKNFHIMEDADRMAVGNNPLCGDIITIYLKIDNGIIQDVSFQGKGCSIAKASASIMTQAIKGKSLEEVEALFQKFHQLCIGGKKGEDVNLGKFIAFENVHEFPVRVKCATLPWHTFQAALKQSQDVVTTEFSDS